MQRVGFLLDALGVFVLRGELLFARFEMVGLFVELFFALGHSAFEDVYKRQLFIQPDVLEKHVRKLEKKYQAIAENETMVDLQYMDDAQYAVVAYGTTARIALTAVRNARKQGVKVGLIRPITVWPFPEKAISDAADRLKGILTVEMSLGQMLDDVRLSVNGKCPVRFFGRTGGTIPGVREVYEQLMNMKEGL